MKNTLSFLFISLISIFNISIRASVEVQARHLTTMNGLSNNSIRYIYQDSKGFIWMSTLNGLNRYDGNSFITFRPRNDQEFSLVDHRVRNLVEDKNGFLWISTSADQFSCYDLKRDCFVDFTGCGEHLENYGYISNFEDEVWLWGRNHGCRRITYENGTFSSKAFNLQKENLLSDNISFLSKDDTGTVWVGTHKGLYYWNNSELVCVENQHAFQWMEHINGKSYFLTSDGGIWVYAHNTLSRVATIPNITSNFELPGKIAYDGKWIIFTKNGGFAFDPKTETVERASSKLDIPNGEVIKDNRGNYWIHNRTGNIWYVQVHSGEVKRLQLMSQHNVNYIDLERYHIVHDSRGIIWISTYGNGLFAYEPRTDQIYHYRSDADRSDLIASNFLQYIMEDRSGSIWVSSEYTGVSLLRVINEGALRFYPENRDTGGEYANRIRMVAATENGDVWLGNRNGELYIYDPNLSVQKGKQHYDTNIYTVCEDADGVMWKGSRGNGLFIGDQLHTNRIDDATSISSDQIFCLHKDRKGRMWVGTFGGGLNLADRDEKGNYTFRSFFKKTYGQRRIRTICEDRNGWFWVGTSDGLMVFDPDELIKNPDSYYFYSFNTGSLASNEIRCIKQDSKGNIWVTESGAGFSVCSSEADYDKLEFTHYGIQDGLVNSMVQAFVEDAQGMMWMSTEYGVSRFDMEQKTFENYFFSENILGNVYTENCALRLPNEKLVFGTNHGLVIINPRLVESTQGEPTVTFTDLKINGISMTQDEQDSPLDGSLAYNDAIRLKHSQNSFAIDFSTLDYSNSIPPKFSYMMENYDSEWSIPSTLNVANFKNLSPGTYYLHVKACNATGVWGSKEAVLRIVITPPFWKTTWAFLIYIVLFAAALYMAYRIIRNMNELRYKIKVEEQLTEYKLIFFTNISHEFRTPLTLIRGALERMHQGKIPREMSYAVKVMDKSTQRMLRLINQLLEFRKMQNNKLALSLEETDVIAFLYEIFLSFRDAADSKKMEFRFNPSVASYKMFIDKGNLDKVAYNLLSNAFKYTPSKGRISLDVTIDEDGHKLIIKVTDTGVGIPKEKRDQLFNRFMQSSFSGSSMGVGLHLTYELVNVHKGQISYEPNPQGGSIFTVVLPTDTAVYKEKDFLVPGNILLREEDMMKGRLEEEPAVKERIEDDEPETLEPTLQTEDTEVSEPLNKRKILIIEDDNDVREFLVHELSAYFEVVAESDGSAGIERAYTYDADLIISDVLMPGYSGFEITRKLKDDFNTSHIPIILLTALTASDSQLEGVESGADAYITKPFSTKFLLTRVFKLIEQRDRLREKFSNDLTMVRPVMYTTDKDKQFIDKLTRIMEEQLENPEFTVDEFASQMALGRTVFYRKVRGITGYAPKEYLRVMRMKKAAELLLSTGDNVAEVAYKVGINDPFYFSKCFKAQFGVSPSAYQKQAKANTSEDSNKEDA